MTASFLRKSSSSGIPLILLLAYLALFAFFERSLGFGSTIEGIDELIFRTETAARIHYRLALALWGSTLICFGAIWTVIVALGATQLSRLAAPIANSDGGETGYCPRCGSAAVPYGVVRA